MNLKTWNPSRSWIYVAFNCKKKNGRKPVETEIQKEAPDPESVSYLLKVQKVSDERQRWRVADAHFLQLGEARGGIPAKQGK